MVCTMTERNVEMALDKIFKAQSVAVVGASANPSKLGYMTLNSIIKGGFEGDIYPINPKADKILGLTAFPSLAELPESVDLAVIIVPAQYVPKVIQEAGAAGVRGAMILTAGFREAGRADLENELAAAAKTGNVRFVGPNVQGINYLPNKLCAMFFPVITTRGPLTVITQSGSATAALSEWAARDGLGINAAVNLGNQTDLTESDYLTYFATDEATGAIAMYLEGVVDGRRFLKTALRTAVTKPVVILKSGRSEAGCRSVASHTGALAGQHEVFVAACRQVGLIVADDMSSLYDRAKGLIAIKPPRGNRLLSISTSGGMGALAADEAEAEGLSIPSLPENFVEALRSKKVSPLANMANPLDLGYVEIEAFRRAAYMADSFDAADIILLNLGDPVPGAVETAIELNQKLKASLVVSYLGGGEEELKACPALHKAGLAVFPSPERAVRGIAASVRAAEYKRSREERRKPILAEWKPPPKKAGASLRTLNELEAAALIKEYGLNYPAHELVHTDDEAVIAAEKLGVPVVLKVVSQEAVHKTEIGGVIKGIASPDDARQGFETILTRLNENQPGTEVEGVLVCRQAEKGIEVIVGGLDDLVFGPTVMFGLGGIKAEALADVAFRVAPLERKDAEEMIREIKGFNLLGGWRGSPPVDLAALSDLIISVSRLMTERPEVKELDLNPVRIYPQGALVLDARAVVRGE